MRMSNLCQVFILKLVLYSLIFSQDLKGLKDIFLPTVVKCEYTTESIRMESPAR